MKRFYFLLIALLTSTVAVAQEPITYHFSTLDGGLIWQNIYETSLDRESIITFLETNGYIGDIIERPDGSISCKLLPRKLNCNVSGFSNMDVSVVMAVGLISGHAIIEFKEGRYRVTTDNMVLSGIFSAYYMLDQFALRRNGKFKDSFFNMDAIIFDYNLFQFFNVNRPAGPDPWQ